MGPGLDPLYPPFGLDLGRACHRSLCLYPSATFATNLDLLCEYSMPIKGFSTTFANPLNIFMKLVILCVWFWFWAYTSVFWFCFLRPTIGCITNIRTMPDNILLLGSYIDPDKIFSRFCPNAA